MNCACQFVRVQAFVDRVLRRPLLVGVPGRALKAGISIQIRRYLEKWAYLPGLHDVKVGKRTVCNVQTLVGRRQPDPTIGTKRPSLRTQSGVTLQQR
jgi:hypothetical protein